MDSNNVPVPNLELAIKRSMLAKNKLAVVVRKPEGIVQFTCVECSAWFYSKKELERHLLVHNKDYRYICGICGTGLKRKEHLDRHTLEHQEVRPHVCPDCGKAFKRKEHLNIHRSIHSGDKSESCPVCNKTFYRKDHLRKHWQTHSKVYIAENVDVADDQESVDIVNDQLVEIKQEILDEYSMPIVVEEQPEEIMEPEVEETYCVPSRFSKSEERPFMCLVCKKSYKKKEHLKLHSRTHMKKDKVCTLCGKAYQRQDQLLAHMNEHLPEDENYKQDEQLDAEPYEPYRTDNSLLIARSASQHNESRPYECEVCHRRFKGKQYLMSHLHVHEKPPVYTVWCSICGEGFLTNEHCEGHQCMSASHDIVSAQFEELPPPSPQVVAPQEAKKENKYPQEYMDVTELASLDSLQFAEVEEKQLPIPVRVFVCKYCSKPFKRKDHYKIHLHIHTGIKSFFCTECGKGFYRKDHLQKHLLVHNKAKPKKEIPDLFPITKLPKKQPILPEITIHAPSNTKLRVPLQIKVPYQMVMSMDNGEQRAVTIDPQASALTS